MIVVYCAKKANTVYVSDEMRGCGILLLHRCHICATFCSDHLYFSPFVIVMKIVAGESFFGCVSDEMRGCSGVFYCCCIGAAVPYLTTFYSDHLFLNPIRS